MRKHGNGAGELGHSAQFRGHRLAGVMGWRTTLHEPSRFCSVATTGELTMQRPGNGMERHGPRAKLSAHRLGGSRAWRTTRGARSPSCLVDRRAVVCRALRLGSGMGFPGASGKSLVLPDEPVLL